MVGPLSNRTGVLQEGEIPGMHMHRERAMRGYSEKVAMGKPPCGKEEKTHQKKKKPLHL